MLYIRYLVKCTLRSNSMGSTNRVKPVSREFAIWDINSPAYCRCNNLEIPWSRCLPRSKK